MSESNIGKLYREYPFLESIVPQAKASGVRVQRFDIDFANSTQVEYEPTYIKPIYFLDKEGQVVDRVGRFLAAFKGWRLVLSSIITGFFGLMMFGAPRQEYVHKALKRMGTDADRVHYAVQILDGKGFFTNTVVLYKLPAGFDNAGQWYRSLKIERYYHPLLGFPMGDIAV